MKKNLLIVSRSTTFHKKSGGMETQLYNLIEYLKDFYNITVLTTSLSIENKKIQTKQESNVKYIFLPNTIPGEYGYTLWENLFWQIPIKHNFKGFGRGFRRRVAEYYKTSLKKEFDFILSQSSSAQDFEITNEKLVIVNHGTTLNEIRNRLSSSHSIKHFVRFFMLDLPVLIYEYFVNNPRLFKKANKIVLISERVRKDFIKQHSAYAKKVVVIPNGIDTNKFKTGKKNKEFTVVYFGRIDNEKGIDRFIAVAKQLPEINFEIYGDGPEAAYYKLQIRNYKNIHYFGALTNDEIAKVLSRSHVFLFLTKRKEGMPMSILEALASGCGIVTTLKDNNLNRTNAYYYVQSEKEAVKIINELRESKKYSKLARNAALRMYSHIQMGKKYLEYLC